MGIRVENGKTRRFEAQDDGVSEPQTAHLNPSLKISRGDFASGKFPKVFHFFKRDTDPGDAPNGDDENLPLEGYWKLLKRGDPKLPRFLIDDLAGGMVRLLGDEIAIGPGDACEIVQHVAD